MNEMPTSGDGRVVQKPTAEILSFLDLLDSAIGRFLDARSTCSPLGKYEADVESLNLIHLCLRHGEGVIALGRTNLVLLPPALVLTRAAFESSIRALWLLQPLHPMDREARWLAHLQGEEEHLDRLADRLAKMPVDLSELVGRRDALSAFRQGVTARLPAGHVVPRKVPDLSSMLRDLGQGQAYVQYMHLSQFTHSSHGATALYRKGLGTGKVLGEYVTPSDWTLPLRILWSAVAASGSRFLQVCGGSVTRFLPVDFAREVQTALDALP